ncbi:hypothetical protein IF1G_04037 [Cordyceps javanica]|uniref:Uncharacterized protein n=1 Tax=Cordyceps javanica TaxID=43265 RepID=A0A545W2F6_9HYPO|nr:hypothetical protein IF1G_04037 [Cordyceps javanica]TQW08065.1 hypothetical protein IF2G_03941 [Cordyceps javanica]
MHPHTHPVPSWHIEVLSNATLEWYAPTTSKERRIRSRQISISSLWGKFLRWLEMSDADKPFILPPKDIDEYPSFSITRENLRHSISSLAVSDKSTALEICQAFCVTVQEGILMGQISTEDMLSALDPFDSASHRIISDMRVGAKVFAMIRSSVSEALEAAQMSRPDAVPDEMWTAMFNFVASINGRFHDVSCFNRLITSMPKSVSADISKDTVFTYVKTFIQAQATRDHRNPSWPWCCFKIGTALGHLDEKQRISLFSRMNQYIQNVRCDADTKMKTSFAWLLTQAYDTQLSTESFTTIYKQISGQYMDHNGYRIWQLAIARLLSDGFLSKDAHKRVAGWNFHDSLPQRWAVTIKSLSTTERPEAAIASLCDFLTDIGETWHLIEGLIVSHALAPCAEMLRAVSRACGKLDIAIALRIAANDTQQGSHLLCGGLTGTKQDHFRKFMRYPKAESFAWRAIKAEGGTVESKMELVDFLSDQYSTSATLSKSQKIRRARRAAAYQMALVGEVSPTVLRNVITAVTLDLDEGLWGRERHLQWATKLVHDQASPQAAQEMQKWLEGWRHLIHDATGQTSITKTSSTIVKSHTPGLDPFDMSRLKNTLELRHEHESKPALSNRFRRNS